MGKAGLEQLSQQDATLEVSDMFQRSIALIGVYDQDEVLRYTNEMFRMAYFIEPGERVDWQTLMRRNFAAGRGTIIEAADIESWIASVRSRRGKARQRTYESDLHDGRFIWVTETRRDDGWIIYVGTDITSLNVSERKLRLANEKLSRQSFTDELTGVSNRRHILAKLQEVLENRQDAWACLVDIDHFKKINDAYGHRAGDDVLVAVAQTARKTIDLKDSFGRVGGEEFLILFVSQTLEEVKSTLGRLRRAIANVGTTSRHSEINVTISGGLTYVSPGDTQEMVFQKADKGLYHAKNNGRNRIYLHKSNGDFKILDMIDFGDSSSCGLLVDSVSCDFQL